MKTGLRGWPGVRPQDRLDECLYRLKGLAAAVGCIGVAVEMQSDGLPYLHTALANLAELAFDEVEAAERVREEMRQEVRKAKGIPEPGKRKERAGRD